MCLKFQFFIPDCFEFSFLALFIAYYHIFKFLIYSLPSHLRNLKSLLNEKH
jgi:hypothetical protein